MDNTSLDIRITKAKDVGFVVWEGGEIIAALEDRTRVAMWIEERLGDIPGERERELKNAASNVERMPNVAQRQESQPRRGMFSR